jgi:peroxiredoxin
MPHRLNQPVPDFRLRGTDGREHTLADVRGSRMTLVVFSCNHCPYVHAYEPRLISLAKRFGGDGLGVVLINSNNDQTHPQDSFDNMVARAREKAYPFPYLRDDTQEVAKAYEAKRTPEVFLLDEKLHLRYHGRIDDNTYEPAEVTEHSLLNAIEDLLDNRIVRNPKTEPVGCTIKWK